MGLQLGRGRAAGTAVWKKCGRSPQVPQELGDTQLTTRVQPQWTSRAQKKPTSCSWPLHITHTCHQMFNAMHVCRRGKSREPQLAMQELGAPAGDSEDSKEEEEEEEEEDETERRGKKGARGAAAAQRGKGKKRSGGKAGPALQQGKRQKVCHVVGRTCGVYLCVCMCVFVRVHVRALAWKIHVLAPCQRKE
eukprot:1143610-Pelagomonas_calceolata.AAC.1